MVATRYVLGDQTISTVTVNAAITELIALDQERTHATIKNISDETIHLSIDDNTVTYGNGIPIVPGEKFQIGLHNHTRLTVYGISSAGGKDVQVMENVYGYVGGPDTVTLGPGSSTIGAVMIADADDSTIRGKVRDGDTAGAADDHVLVVQHQGPTGESQPSGADAADPVTTASMLQDADSTDRAVVRDANGATAIDDHVLVVQHQSDTNKVQPSGADAADPIYTASSGSVSGVINKWLGSMGLRWSPVDFTAAYHGATTINLTGLPFPVTVEQIFGVLRIDNSGDSEWLSPDNAGYQFAWDNVNSRITITGASLVATDTYVVAIAADPAALNLTLDAYKGIIENWPVDTESTPLHEDRTDDTAGAYPDTEYFPSSDGFELVGYRRATLEFNLGDAAIVVEARNHEDLSWLPITQMATIYKLGAAPAVAPNSVGAAGINVEGYLDFTDLGVDEIRVARTIFDATNTTQLNWRWRA